MTYQEFEERLDALLIDAGPAENRDAILARLPVEMREKAAECPRCRQLLSDWVWLHEQIAQLPAPQPSHQFSKNVILRLARPAAADELDDVTAIPQRSFWRTAGSVGVLITGLAASVAIGVLFLPREAGNQNQQVASSEEPVDLRDHLRDTGTAYLALAQVMADAVRLADPGSPTPETETGNQTESTTDAVARANPPAIHEAIRGSTETFVDAGRDIGSTIRPITDSAVGAFSFLLPPSKSSREKPSI